MDQGRPVDQSPNGWFTGAVDGEAGSARVRVLAHLTLGPPARCEQGDDEENDTGKSGDEHHREEEAENDPQSNQDECCDDHAFRVPRPRAGKTSR